MPVLQAHPTATAASTGYVDIEAPPGNHHRIKAEPVQITHPRRQGTLIRRYKRFLADIRLENGRILTVHCPNSGSMLGCSAPRSQVLSSRSSNPGRKYPWTLEMVRVEETWVGVNTSRTNRLVEEALTGRIIDDFGKIRSISREVTVSAGSRLDFLLETDHGRVYLEVKNCSLVENNIALFPDAVTARGTRHLQELSRLRGLGHRAALIFCIQRGDAESFQPAAAIDPAYAETLHTIYTKGVLILAYRADVRPDRIIIASRIPVLDGTTTT